MIREFRANAGWVGGRWEGYPLLLLYPTDAKSGVIRTSPRPVAVVSGVSAGCRIPLGVRRFLIMASPPSRS
jgi:hypothetical protein